MTIYAIQRKGANSQRTSHVFIASFDQKGPYRLPQKVPKQAIQQLLSQQAIWQVGDPVVLHFLLLHLVKSL